MERNGKARSVGWIGSSVLACSSSGIARAGRMSDFRACRTCFTCLALILVLCSQAYGQPPNIVLIFTDDQGWNGTSVQMDPNVLGSKSDFYQTPRLEQLANAGMRFSNGYSSTPVCAMSRAALQTGMTAAQLQMTDMPQALPPGETTRWDLFYTRPLSPLFPLPVSLIRA